MCYVCSCFGWVLDFIQRVVTFLLACWLCCAVILVLVVAIFAGVAYGYNYSMAEFLTFTRSDVTVYMRRGQFHDQPDVRPRSFRRSGGDDDAFPEMDDKPNVNPDYEAKPREDASALPDSWAKSHDTRAYAEKLSKYSPVFAPQPPDRRQEKAVQAELATDVERRMLSTPGDYYKMTSSLVPVSRLISAPPNRILSTAVFQSGSSKIIMRNFHMSTMKDAEDMVYNEREYDADKDFHPDKYNKDKEGKPTNTHFAYGPGRHDVTKSSHGPVSLRHWASATTPMFQDYSDEVDEDNIIYKPG